MPPTLNLHLVEQIYRTYLVHHPFIMLKMQFFLILIGFIFSIIRNGHSDTGITFHQQLDTVIRTRTFLS